MISIHASREGSDYEFNKYIPAHTEISIHASREGSDDGPFTGTWYDDISIHASREGSDAVFRIAFVLFMAFQSTLPAREATFHA